MAVCLVTAPTVAEFEDPAEIRSESVQRAAREPQLGVLSLAAVLESRGECVRVLDLNRSYLHFCESGARDRKADFAETAAHSLVAERAEIYGFSSICSSYPLTLRIAKAVKALCPGSTILMGGPQASVVDLQTLCAFPFVDLILRGEAEHTVQILLDEMRGEGKLEQVPGLSYRVNRQARRNPSASVINDLDSLPLPAYHLGEYLQGASRASLELGRGCPFSCTFCSTNDFFRRKFRLRSPERVLRDMRIIAATYSIRNFELIHDMFTVDRRRVQVFCEAMLASGEGFTWSCSARTDCIDKELLRLMARAGCNGIFYGVEVGSEKMQRVIDKHLNTKEACEIINITERLGIASTVSLISGFPEETWDDVRRSMDVFMVSAHCVRSHPQLNLLAPLAETPLLSKHKDDLMLEKLCSCVSHQGHSQNPADLKMITRHPAIFPNFYVIRTPSLERDRLFELREFSLIALARFRWILVAIDQNTSGILDYFMAWREHRLRIRPALGFSDLRQYYRTDDFCADFTAFVRAHEVGKAPVVRALLDYQDAIQRNRTTDTRVTPVGDRLLPGTAFRPQDIPVRRNGILVFELSYEIQRVIDALKLQKKTILSRGRYFYITRPMSSSTVRIDEISNWMAYLLRLCDGRQRIEVIAQTLSAQLPEVKKSVRPYACTRLLEGAQNRQFIEIYRSASDSDLAVA
jgi:hypothetical protein